MVVQLPHPTTPDCRNANGKSLRIGFVQESAQTEPLNRSLLVTIHSLTAPATIMSDYSTPTTLPAVRDYVLGSSQGQARAAHTVLLHVSHSNLKKTHFAELRMDLRTSVADVKARLYTHTGTRPASMTLLLRGPGGEVRAELDDEAAPLGRYSPCTGDTLYVVDDDPNSASANGWLENTDLVPKYVLSDEVYDKKPDTYRKFKAKMRETDPTWSMTSALAAKLNSENKPNAAVNFAEATPPVAVGDRVEVFPGGKRGEVRYVGRDLVGLPEGWWVGVCYDEPVGKNNGTVKGVCYFEAAQNHGGLARPSNVSVGDFPPLEEDGFGDEDEDEI